MVNGLRGFSPRNHKTICDACLCSRHGQRQDLTRMNTDYADVRGFVPKALMPPMALTVSHVFCSTTSGGMLCASQGNSLRGPRASQRAGVENEKPRDASASRGS